MPILNNKGAVTRTILRSINCLKTDLEQEAINFDQFIDVLLQHKRPCHTYDISINKFGQEIGAIHYWSLSHGRNFDQIIAHVILYIYKYMYLQLYQI